MDLFPHKWIVLMLCRFSSCIIWITAGLKPQTITVPVGHLSPFLGTEPYWFSSHQGTVTLFTCYVTVDTVWQFRLKGIFSLNTWGFFKNTTQFPKNPLLPFSYICCAIWMNLSGLKTERQRVLSGVKHNATQMVCYYSFSLSSTSVFQYWHLQHSCSSFVILIITLIFANAPKFSLIAPFPIEVTVSLHCFTGVP